MLRYGYLPSDYHPMMLLLGEQRDLERLAEVLAEFARCPRTVPLSDLVMVHPAAHVTIALQPGATGLQPGPRAGDYVWGMTADAAAAFAELVGALARPECSAGSEQLEVGAAGEIPVKVSRGEFTDDFLVETH